MKSTSNVFIVESLSLSDETHRRFEGQILSNILHLAGIDSIYYYIRTEREFQRIIKSFEKSGYRYLHISCHGSENCLWTTLDKISFKRLSDLIGAALDDKRLFLSACSATNSDLADSIFSNTDCLSIIGPKKDVLFDDAAIFWASFYQLMFKKNSNKMNRANLVEILSKLSELHEVPVKYFACSNKHRRGWQNIPID